MSQSEFYGGGGGGGGGGYIQGGSPFSVGGSPGGIRKTEISHSLRPVTVGQLVRATQAHTDAEWVIGNTEIGQISLVASVVSIQAQATNCVYVLDDGSGRIEARHWIDANEESGNKFEGIEENTYVRVTGGLKAFGSKRYVNATHIHPCKDPHEIMFHTCEAMFANIVFERGPPPRPGQANPQAAGGSGVAGSSAYANQSTSAADTEYSHLPPVQRKIVQFILSQPPNHDGVHIAAIARAIGGNAAEISEAVDRLMDDGLLFSTIDESHFNVAR